MTKCIYCDFNHPDHIGAEIYSDEYIPEEVMYEEKRNRHIQQKNSTFLRVKILMNS